MCKLLKIPQSSRLYIYEAVSTRYTPVNDSGMTDVITLIQISDFLAGQIYELHF